MVTIAHALERIKGNLEQFVPERLVQRLSTQAGLGPRPKVLTPVVTTYLFLRQILHGNVACSRLRHLSSLEFTDSAYCQARGKIPYSFFDKLQRAVTGRILEADPLRPAERWRGHDVYFIDGSSFSMADTPELQEAFGQPSVQAPGCGFPTAHLLVSCQFSTGYIRKVLVAPLATHDLAQVPYLQPSLPANAVVVGDRAFCSFAHLALCQKGGRHGLFRGHQKQIVDFRPGRPHASPDMPAHEAKGLPRSRWLKRLGPQDQLVEYVKPKERPSWMSEEEYAALPLRLKVRELRYRIKIPGRRTREITLVTTLLDPRRYSRQALAALYALRWGLETNLGHLKTTLKMDVLHCQTFPGVMKEVAIFITVYNLVRRVMRQAAASQAVPADRISFVDALRWLADAAPTQPMPRLKVVPHRPGRAEPRARKRRPKEFDLLNKPRPELRQALLDQNDTDEA